MTNDKSEAAIADQARKNEETREKMDTAAAEAKVAFSKLMKKADASAADLVAFHQKWYMRAGHKRLGFLYRDFGK